MCGRRPLLSFLIAVAAFPLAETHAQVAFTVTATAEATKAGYTSGQAYTFTYVLANRTAFSNDDLFNSTLNRWQEEHVEDPALWSAISGTGLLGSYVRPVSHGLFNAAGYPDAFVETTDIGGNDRLRLHVASDGFSAGKYLGLQSPSGFEVYRINATIDGYAQFTYGGTVSTTQPQDYFAAFLGSFSPVTGTRDLNITFMNGVSADSLSFQVTGLQIAAIPEPSSAALWLGWFACLWAASRRRRAGAISPA